VAAKEKKEAGIVEKAKITKNVFRAYRRVAGSLRGEVFL